ncbi:uncharacterized protein LOC133184890 [Saccostrea echinata]|uniref:uncharacterized protein LOC133184890 n=1 Tax=Saccostrea echinata TaxID=191078 RepID=UPI002A80FC14|nr:uncharacterized protein LOC133184890 [Saccostrea echinata]
MGRVGVGNLVFLVSVITGVKALVSTNKPGKCPLPTYSNAGGNCKSDRDCSGSLKCCPHTLAGFACMKPEASSDIKIARPGECPVITDTKTGISCERDADCMEPQICCTYGQSSICLYPTIVNTLPKFKEPVFKPGLHVLSSRLFAVNRWLLRKLKLRAQKRQKKPTRPKNVNSRIQKLLARLSPKKSTQQRIFQSLNNFIFRFLQKRKKHFKPSIKVSKINNPVNVTTLSEKSSNTTSSPELIHPGGVPIVSRPDIVESSIQGTSVPEVAPEVYPEDYPVIIPIDELTSSISTESPKSVNTDSPIFDILKTPTSLLPAGEPELFPEENPVIISVPEELVTPEPEPSLPTSTAVPDISTSMSPTVQSTDVSLTQTSASMALPSKFQVPSVDITSENSIAEPETARRTSPSSFKPVWHIIDPMSKQKIPLGQSSILDVVSPAERMYEQHINEEYGPLKEPSDAQTSFDNHFASYLQKTMLPPESNSIYPENSLLYPEVEIFKPEKQGSCPVNLMYRRCETNCKFDDDCPGVDKCCDMGCGNVCVTPKEKKIY